MTNTSDKTSRIASWSASGFSGRALSAYIRLAHRTSRIVADPPDSIERYARTAPHITALWHGQFMLVPTVAPKEAGSTAIMVARHGDAEVLGAVMQSFDMMLIRGAGAGERKKDRGGTAALRAALKALKAGQNVAMTADVPPGPARRAGPGIAVLAKLSGRPVVPVAVASSRFVTVNTWSRLTLNMPFSKIGVSVGEPITVARTATDAQLEMARIAIEQEMVRVTERAYRAVGRDHYSAMPPNAMPAEAPPLPLGSILRGYRGLTALGEPLAPLILRRREKRGKEPTDRRPERVGRAGQARPSGPLIWFHAASVGERNAILPAIHRIAELRPDQRLLLTTGTVTSASNADELLPDGAIHQFMPIDAPGAVRRYLDHWKPNLAVFTESEIWPNAIMALNDRDVPIILANARLSERSFKRWRKARRTSAQLFSRFSLVLAQNEPLTRRFRALGARTVRPVGNIKVDAPRQRVDADRFAALVAAVGGRPMLLAASTHPTEEEVVLDAHEKLRATHPGLLTVIAPRHPDRGEDISRLAVGRGLATERRSAGALPAPQTDIYVADTLGELGLLYRAASIAFIGGSLADKGGQNPIEAIRENAVILCGPKTYNFADAY
ncbi:MAG: glycosyltransferase N-terminal domain-containing protein, partial [Pseudomonadota bacterium]